MSRRLITHKMVFGIRYFLSMLIGWRSKLNCKISYSGNFFIESRPEQLIILQVSCCNIPSCTFALMFFAASFWDTLIQWDHSLFETINSDWANPFFDRLMPFMRQSKNWIPLYVLTLLFLLYKYGWKSLWWVLFFGLTVALTDSTGTYLFKHNIERLRPCRDPEFASHVRLLLKQCAGGYGFISNHAANHFGMAAFFFITFKPVCGRWVWLAMAWAITIAFAQVYVGVHFPLDVLAGALLGLCFGLTTGYIFNKRGGFAIFGHQPTGSP